MRNYELIKEIYELCNREPDVGSGEIMNIIERERPRIADSDWELALTSCGDSPHGD